jgi:GNAT superfamily N-acetyltransferase
VTGYEIVRVSSREGKVIEPARLAQAESVHRQLRPQIPEPYFETMLRILGSGAQMAVAMDGEEVAGVAIFRVIDNTHVGRKLYVDDLVTDSERRSSGAGHSLLGFLEAEARHYECVTLDLDSGTQREQAHKFYFREGFTVKGFSFSKPLR